VAGCGSTERWREEWWPLLSSDQVSIRIVGLLLGLVMCPGVASAMNDTDAVVADGLFPLAASAGIPSLLLEKVDIRLRLLPDGFEKSINYRIRHPGNSRSYVIGYVIDDPAPGGWYGPYGMKNAETRLTIELDGAPATPKIRTGRLVDEGDHVRIDHRTQAEIDTCNAHNDGDICGHHWAELEVSFGEGQRRNVRVRSLYGWPDNLNYAPDAITRELAIYTEKFWAGRTVPQIEIRLDTSALELSADRFSPHGGYGSRVPTSLTSSEIRWVIRDFAPVKKPMEFGSYMLRPQAVDREVVRKQIQRLKG
jgi:hypothetical protein